MRDIVLLLMVVAAKRYYFFSSSPVEMGDVNDSRVKNNKLVTSVSSNSSFRDLIPFLGWVGCERVKQWKA